MQNNLNRRTNGVCPSLLSVFWTYSSIQVFAPTGRYLWISWFFLKDGGHQTGKTSSQTTGAGRNHK